MADRDEAAEHYMMHRRRHHHVVAGGSVLSVGSFGSSGPAFYTTAQQALNPAQFGDGDNDEDDATGTATGGAGTGSTGGATT